MSDEGTVIGGRYRLLAPVGRGATSVVWRARDERLDRVVAVKELTLDPADDPAAGRLLRRAQREGRVAARLDHPHAVTVHDVLTRDGTAFLVMEYVAGESLAASLARRGTLPAPEVAAVGAALAAALAAAHDEGILHRDVKPGNVLVTAEGSVTLVDFGISRIVGEATGTGAGLVAGTPAYLAPEVAAGETVGTAADVFSLGATLLTALEGTPPFGDADDPV
ncbi:serine/threonine-protein kinase, partial [Saccharomonospora iraqiensis]|uniref:serine/threonine-protein kinase n=1 Tax=Saccharomonospora iraqiensis TaxID=52698 RepID=UPI00048D80C5